MKNFIKSQGIIAVLAVFGLAALSFAACARQPVDFIERGFTAMNAENFEQAIADFDQAISLEQNITYAHLGRAYSFISKNEWDGVAAAFMDAITSTPAYIDAFSQRIHLDIVEDFDQVRAGFESNLNSDLVERIRGDVDIVLRLAYHGVNMALMLNSLED